MNSVPNPELHIAPNDPSLARGVAQRLITDFDRKMVGRAYRLKRAAKSSGFFTPARLREFFGDGLVAQQVVREHGDRALWAIAGLAGDDDGAVALIQINRARSTGTVTYRPAIIAGHAVARLLQRTVHAPDIGLITRELHPFLKAILKPELMEVCTGADTQADSVQLISERGALIGAKVRGESLLLRTWIDRSQFHQRQRQLLAAVAPGTIAIDINQD